jgi:hypothetical protein
LRPALLDVHVQSCPCRGCGHQRRPGRDEAGADRIHRDFHRTLHLALNAVHPPPDYFACVLFQHDFQLKSPTARKIVTRLAFFGMKCGELARFFFEAGDFQCEPYIGFLQNLVSWVRVVIRRGSHGDGAPAILGAGIQAVYTVRGKVPAAIEH